MAIGSIWGCHCDAAFLVSPNGRLKAGILVSLYALPTRECYRIGRPLRPHNDFTAKGYNLRETLGRLCFFCKRVAASHRIWSRTIATCIEMAWEDWPLTFFVRSLLMLSATEHPPCEGGINKGVAEGGGVVLLLCFCHCFRAAFTRNEFTFATQFWLWLFSQRLSPNKTVNHPMVCKVEVRFSCANAFRLSRKLSRHWCHFRGAFSQLLRSGF